jgi:hypothetical protein
MNVSRRNTHAWEERLLEHLTPEQRLGVALFAQTLRDACHPDYRGPAHAPLPKSSWQGKENTAFQAARVWLLTEREEVRWWLNLLNLPEVTYDRLIAAAGLREEDRR